MSEVFFICDNHVDLISKRYYPVILSTLANHGYNHIFTEGYCSYDLTQSTKQIVDFLNGEGELSLPTLNAVNNCANRLALKTQGKATSKQPAKEKQIIDELRVNNFLITSYIIEEIGINNLNLECFEEDKSFANYNTQSRSIAMVIDLASKPKDSKVIAMVGAMHCGEIRDTIANPEVNSMLGLGSQLLAHYIYPFTPELGAAQKKLMQAIDPGLDTSFFCETKECAGKVEAILESSEADL